MTLRGVLIDPHTRTVSEVKLPPDDAFAPLLDAERFECIVLRHPTPGDPGAALHLDEEGREKPGQRFWSFTTNPDRIYAGRGLLTAIDVDGDTCGGLSPPEVIEPHVVWRNVRYLGTLTEEDDSGGLYEVRLIPQFEEVPNGH